MLLPKNFAIDQAKGDWIAFLDADESFTPEETAKIPEILEYVGEDVDGLRYRDRKSG